MVLVLVGERSQAEGRSLRCGEEWTPRSRAKPSVWGPGPSLVVVPAGLEAEHVRAGYDCPPHLRRWNRVRGSARGVEPFLRERHSASARPAIALHASAGGAEPGIRCHPN